MDRVLAAPADESVRRSVRDEVRVLCETFPLYDLEALGLAEEIAEGA
jgi:hypothetical protein